jgi:hypothetical protein
LTRGVMNWQQEQECRSDDRGLHWISC